MTIEEDVLNYISTHPNCTRIDIQYGLGLSLGEVNGCISFLGKKVQVVDKFELPARFVVA